MTMLGLAVSPCVAQATATTTPTLSATAPVLAALADGDTLSDAVTWGAVTPIDGVTITETRLMQLTAGGGWVAYDGDHEAAYGEVIAVRQVWSAPGYSTLTRTSAGVMVAGIAPTLTVSLTGPITPGSTVGTPSSGADVEAVLGGSDGVPAGSYTWTATVDGASRPLTGGLFTVLEADAGLDVVLTIADASHPTGPFSASSSAVTVAAALTVTDDGDGILTLSGSGVLDEITVTGSDYPGTYTAWADTGAIDLDALDLVAGRWLAVPTVQYTDADTSSSVTVGDTVYVDDYGLLLSPGDPTLSIQWYDDDGAIPGATDLSYVLLSAQGGETVYPVLTATLAGETSTTITLAGLAVAEEAPSGPTFTEVFADDFSGRGANEQLEDDADWTEVYNEGVVTATVIAATAELRCAMTTGTWKDAGWQCSATVTAGKYAEARLGYYNFGSVSRPSIGPMIDVGTVGGLDCYAACWTRRDAGTGYAYAIEIRRLDNGAPTVLAQASLGTTLPFTAGEALRIRRSSAGALAVDRDTGSGWTEILTATDTTYNSGTAGIYAQMSDSIGSLGLTDFACGTYIPGV